MSDNTTLTDGTEITNDDHLELREDGQQKDYVVLSKEERGKGYIRPYRDSYIHIECGITTKMGQAIAETYARNPSFYGSTFCLGCGKHFPVKEFVWAGAGTIVGS